MIESLFQPERAADAVKQKGHAWLLYLMVVATAALPGAVLLGATPDGTQRLTEQVEKAVPADNRDRAVGAAKVAVITVPLVARAGGLLMVAAIAFALLAAVQRKVAYAALVGGVSIGGVPLLVGDVARSLAMVLKQSAQAGDLSLGLFEVGEDTSFFVRVLLGADLFVLFSTLVMVVVLGRMSGTRGLVVWVGPLIALLGTMLLRGLGG